MHAGFQSTKARKQRRRHFTAPLSRRRRALSCHLDGKLIAEYGTRSFPVRKGDTVKLLRGPADLVGTEAKVAEVDVKNMRITVEGITVAKADKTEKARPIHASNVLITKLDLSNPRRKAKLESHRRTEAKPA